jgi:hypothetical protein
LAFLRNESQPGILTFHIFTIEAEALESENFNPLTEPSGYLSLKKRQLVDLVHLLRSNAERLAPMPPDRSAMFRRIETPKLSDFHLRSPLVPNSRDWFYYQTHDPMAQAREELTLTLLILSTAQGPRPHGQLYFKIARFPLKALNEPSFNPLDHSLPKIDLNKSGMEELARLLELHQEDLVDDE